MHPTTLSPSRRRPSLAVVLVTAIVGSLMLAAPAAAADPVVGQPVREAARSAAEPFRLDLYREGDFVGQSNLVQCVGASMQMMLNMMRARDDRSAAYQLELPNLARKWSPRSFSSGDANGQVRPRRGASSRGWAFGLTKLGYGPYRVTSASTLEDAVAWAALAMRRTGRPVGLLVWQGAHAWVMSGFEATADPLVAGAEITHVRVLDPLYPRTSSTWGTSPAPDTRLSLKQLAADFVPWRPGRSNGMSGRYVIVMPFPDARPLPGSGHALD